MASSHVCLVAQSCLTLCHPMDRSPPGSSVHGILQARILEWVAMPSSRGSSQLRDQTWVSHIAGRFFTSWGTGKPKNTGVDSLSLLQRIFPTQELNQCLLHSKWILWQPTPVFLPGESHGQKSLVGYSIWSWVGYDWATNTFFTNWAIREAHFVKWNTNIYFLVTCKELLSNYMLALSGVFPQDVTQRY